MSNVSAILARAVVIVSALRRVRFATILVAVLAGAATSTAQDAALPNQPAAVETTPLVLEKYVAPAYPEIAASARVQGIVIIEGTVGAAGQAGDVRVLRSIPLLDNAAMDAVRQWRFATPASGTRFTAVVNFVFSNIPAADDAPATSVGWPPADFALYYGFECRGRDGRLIASSMAVSAYDALRRPPVALTPEGRQRLSLLLIQEGFFNIPGAATERERRESVQVEGGRIELTVTAMAGHAHVDSVAMDSQSGARRGSADQPEFHHALMVRTYGTWRKVEWAEPVADGDERNAEASRVGAAVRRFFRSLPATGEPETAECR